LTISDEVVAAAGAVCAPTGGGSSVAERTAMRREITANGKRMAFLTEN
jgi:hypothetical protein